MLLHDIATRAATQQRLSEQSPQHHRFTLDFSDLFSRVFESLVVFCRPVRTTTFGMCSHHVIVSFFFAWRKKRRCFKKIILTIFSRTKFYTRLVKQERHFKRKRFARGLCQSRRKTTRHHAHTLARSLYLLSSIVFLCTHTHKERTFGGQNFEFSTLFPS